MGDARGQCGGLLHHRRGDGLTVRLGLGPEWQSGLATGLAGGLTTFSSWTTATVRLVSETRYRAAAANIAANLIAGLAAAALGLAVTAV